jgi:transposase-like protein
MPVRKGYTVEFKEQAVRYVFDEIGPDESRSAAVEGLAPKLNVKPATLMNRVRAAAPAPPRPAAAQGSVGGVTGAGRGAADGEP